MSSSPLRSDLSSPSRQLLVEDRQARKNGYHQSRRQIQDSPSRQILEEFSRLLVNDDRLFKAQLDEQAHKQEQLHRAALAESLKEHEKVREAAERAREQVELQIRIERQRREASELQALEQARRVALQEKANNEAEERRLELEQAQQEQENRRKAAEHEARVAQGKAQAEAQRMRDVENAAKRVADRLKAEQEERDRKVREDAAAAEKARTQPPSIVQPRPAPTTNGTPSVNGTRPAAARASAAPVELQKAVKLGLVSSREQLESTHKSYLDLHKRLKELRKFVLTETNKPEILRKFGIPKGQLSDWRRELRKKIGMMTQDKEKNRGPMKATLDLIIHAANKVPEPTVDIRNYFALPPNTNATPQVPGVLIFFLSHFSKLWLTQCAAELVSKTEMAEPYGVFASTIFARKELRWDGLPLIDIMLAKYHKLCPVLFGIYGSQKTEQGRVRIGWQRDKDSGAWAAEQMHYESMTGLGSGFASLSLRDFKKSSNPNPLPNTHYWAALARIVNTPPNEVQPTHLVVLKAMVDNYVPRFISFFGQAGVAALKKALVHFPKNVPEGSRSFVVAVETLAEVYETSLRLTLR